MGCCSASIKDVPEPLRAAGGAGPLPSLNHWNLAPPVFDAEDPPALGKSKEASADVHCPGSSGQKGAGIADGTNPWFHSLRPGLWGPPSCQSDLLPTLFAGIKADSDKNPAEHDPGGHSICNSFTSTATASFGEQPNARVSQPPFEDYCSDCDADYDPISCRSYLDKPHRGSAVSSGKYLDPDIVGWSASRSSTGTHPQERPFPSEGGFPADRMQCLVRKLGSLSTYIRMQPTCRQDLAGIRVSAQHALSFLSEHLPQAISRSSGTDPIELLRALLATAGSSSDRRQCQNRSADIVCSMNVLQHLGQTEIDRLLMGAGQLDAILRSAALLTSRQGLVMVRSLLQDCLLFLDELGFMARQRQMCAWDLFQEVAQIRAYTTIIEEQRAIAARVFRTKS